MRVHEYMPPLADAVEGIRGHWLPWSYSYRQCELPSVSTGTLWVLGQSRRLLFPRSHLFSPNLLEWIMTSSPTQILFLFFYYPFLPLPQSFVLTTEKFKKQWLFLNIWHFVGYALNRTIIFLGASFDSSKNHFFSLCSCRMLPLTLLGS